MVAQQELAIYCLDTSALLFMADRYPADTFANVWEALSEMAGSGIVVAAREVRRELEVKDSNGAYAWAKANRSLFQALNGAQITLVEEIVNAPEFGDLIDVDSELPDATPFSAALAISLRARGNLFQALPALVAVDSPSRGATLAQVCQTYSDRIRYLTPYQMLREADLDVPEPGGRGLADLYGIWKDLDITEADIQAARIGLGADRF